MGDRLRLFFLHFSFIYCVQLKRKESLNDEKHSHKTIKVLKMPNPRMSLRSNHSFPQRLQLFEAFLVTFFSVRTLCWRGDHNRRCRSLCRACLTQVLLRRDVTVRNVGFFAKNWKVSDDIYRRNVASDNNEARKGAKRRRGSERGSRPANYG